MSSQVRRSDRESKGRPPGRLGTVLTVVIALVIGASALTPVAGAVVDRVEGPFESVVPVAAADNPLGLELMFAECDFVHRLEKSDGSAVETQKCHLTEPFFIFPGTPPTTAFNHTAGPCVWFSDYFLQTTGEDVTAESVRITVTPSGNVSVKTMYPAEPTDC